MFYRSQKSVGIRVLEIAAVLSLVLLLIRVLAEDLRQTLEACKSALGF
jgi:hypothetical protein